MSKCLKTEDFETLELVDSLVRLMPRLMKGMERFFGQDAPFGDEMSPSQFQVLLALRSRAVTRGINMGDLADELGLSRGTLTAIAKKLSGLGFVTRERSLNDDRVVVVRLSPLGEEFTQKEESRVRTAFRKILSQLPSEKQVSFLKSHETLVTLLEEIIQREDSEGKS